jgi:RuvB-like protein 2
MIISTTPYSVNELRQILQVRCKEEDVTMEDTALELLTRIASECTLRYAIHLISISYLAALKRKRKIVQLTDIERCYKLFVDVKRSTQLLIDEYHKGYMFNEITSSTTTTATTTDAPTAASATAENTSTMVVDDDTKKDNKEDDVSKDETKMEIS